MGHASRGRATGAGKPVARCVRPTWLAHDVRKRTIGRRRIRAVRLLTHTDVTEDTAMARLEGEERDRSPDERLGDAAIGRRSTPEAASAGSPMRDEEAVRRRAYELYQQRGGEHGHDLEDWLTAEREVLGGAVVRGDQPEEPANESAMFGGEQRVGGDGLGVLGDEASPSGDRGARVEQPAARGAAARRSSTRRGRPTRGD